MMNQNDILTALQNGQDPMELAQNFADALNAAVAEHKAQEEAARQAAETNNRKGELVVTAMNAVFDLLEEFYPELYDAEMRNIDPKVILEAADEAYAATQARLHEMNKLIAMLKSELEDNEIKAKPVKAPAATKNSDPLEAFLRANHLLS